jgi:hypothetical protein
MFHYLSRMFSLRQALADLRAAYLAEEETIRLLDADSDAMLCVLDRVRLPS